MRRTSAGGVVGRLGAEAREGSCGSLLQSTGSASLHMFCPESWLLFSQLPLEALQLMIQCLGRGERVMGLPAGKLGAHSRVLTCPRRGHYGREVLLVTQLCRLGVRAMQAPPGYSSFLSNVSKLMFILSSFILLLYFASAVCRNFPAGLLDSTKALLSGGDWFMVLLGPPDRGPDQLVPRSICLLPGPRVGGAPPWSLGVWGSWEDQRHKGLQPNPPSSGVVPESMAGTPVSESAAGVSLPSQNASPYSWTKKAGNETSRM